MITDRERIVTHVTTETKEKVEAFMQISGMTKARVCALAITAGIDAISLAFDPNWKAFFEAKMKTEIDKM